MSDFIIPRCELLNYLNRKLKKLRGDWLFIELLFHPNQLIHCSRLKNLFNKQARGTQEFEVKENFDEDSGIQVGYGWDEAPIKYLDYRALKECYEELKLLAQEEEVCEDWNDFGRLQDIRDERSKIKEYISECIDAAGKIKDIRNKQHNDYRSVYKTLQRSIDQIRIDLPELIPYIDEHLVIGIYCEWKEAI